MLKELKEFLMKGNVVDLAVAVVIGGAFALVIASMVDNIINPSKVINEQFAPIIVTKNDGSVMSGVVVNLSGDGVTLNTDLTDPNQRVNVDRKEVKSIELSTVSPMPPMLLAMLKKDEILDLLAYVLSGGDKANAMFGK